MENQKPATVIPAPETIDESTLDLISFMVLHTAKAFNSMATEGKSKEPDFPKDKLPSLNNEKFANALESIQLLAEKLVQMDATTDDLIGTYVTIIATSMALAYNDSFISFRLRLNFGFFDNGIEEQAVKSLAQSGLIRGLGIPFKMQASAFSQVPRPKANDLRRDLELQLALRLFLYTTACWYGADAKQAKLIYDRHLTVSWSHVMCGMYEEAVALLEKPKHNRRY